MKIFQEKFSMWDMFGSIGASIIIWTEPPMAPIIMVSLFLWIVLGQIIKKEGNPYE